VTDVFKLPNKLGGLNVIFILMVGLILAFLLILALFPGSEQEMAGMADKSELAATGPASANNATATSTSGALLPSQKRTGSDTDIFADLRLEREKSRSRKQELFEEITQDPESSSDLRNAAQQELWRLTRIVTLEDELEGILRARGYQQVIVLLQDRSATVFVGKTNLKDAEVTDIAGIIARISGIPGEGIRIYEKRLSD